ncbi:dTMP kinase [Agarivorans sp. B2Z047]|uniref:dTMP kinase n=1 Tax=Agarivorans sp. B2Z047 TaxID=2652721 RepID=UPI00128CD1A3|nr:dTMP kinase [Agarivorans sp. B2Z047]MPW30896.1 dTMP kinase [Agarivorans sp. B2Z047]UQN40875.1 dTMP kinase [Agarivorans sp. B2Z047]
MTRGKFVVIEGLEGAGKSTAVAAIQTLLEQQGIEYINTREPGGTPIAESLRTIVKQGVDGEQVSDSTELLLMYAARAQLVETRIKPALSKGKWVVGDRHDLSSQAYQGGGRELGVDKLQAIKQIAIGSFEPDLTLYLDIEPGLGLSRARERGELDRIEQQALSFFERSRAVYLAQAEANDNIVKVDASQSIDKVASDIQAALNNYLNTL